MQMHETARGAERPQAAFAPLYMQVVQVLTDGFVFVLFYFSLVQVLVLATCPVQVGKSTSISANGKSPTARSSAHTNGN